MPWATGVGHAHALWSPSHQGLCCRSLLFLIGLVMHFPLVSLSSTGQKQTSLARSLGWYFAVGPWGCRNSTFTSCCSVSTAMDLASHQWPSYTTASQSPLLRLLTVITVTVPSGPFRGSLSNSSSITSSISISSSISPPISFSIPPTTWPKEFSSLPSLYNSAVPLGGHGNRR